MPLRIGHRGAAGTHPENTLASFRRAVELGCHGVEFDIHRTRDGHIVVHHDAVLGRTCNGKGFIRDLTLAELKAFDAGAWKGTPFAGETIPTLQELIESTPASLKLFCELKAGSIHYPGIETELLRLIRESGARERFQISSFDHKGLQQIRELDPDIPLGMLFSENLLDPVSMALAIGANALHPNWEWVTPGMVQAAHKAGLQVNTWTVNLPPALELVKYCGVDGIMSDFPDRV